MSDLGSDVWAAPGLDPAFRLVSGRLAHAQAIVRRLATERGDLERLGDDPAYGYDVRRHVGDDTGPRTDFEVAAAVERQALADERTRTATATVTAVAGTLTIALRISDADGPFSLVLAVTDVTVTLLKVT